MKKAKHIEFVLREGDETEAKKILKEMSEKFGKRYYLGCYYDIEIVEEKK